MLSEYLAACADETKAIGLKLGHSGVFPGEQRTRIFWLGVEDTLHAGDLKTFARCCRQAGRATLRKRTAKEEPFRDHITLARRRGVPGPLAAKSLAEIPQSPEVKWVANRLTLFQSELHRDGARYRMLEEFELAG